MRVNNISFGNVYKINTGKLLTDSIYHELKRDCPSDEYKLIVKRFQDVETINPKQVAYRCNDISSYIFTGDDAVEYERTSKEAAKPINDAWPNDYKYMTNLGQYERTISEIAETLAAKAMASGRYYEVTMDVNIEKK